MNDTTGIEIVQCWAGPLDGRAFYMHYSEESMDVYWPGTTVAQGRYERLRGSAWMHWRPFDG